MEKHYASENEVLYHVGFAKEALKGATIAVLPGDPGRVEPLARQLGVEPSFIACHREYTSWLTHISGQPVLVCSTGMGGPSVAICLEELARMGITQVIRVGTTGTCKSILTPVRSSSTRPPCVWMAPPIIMLPQAFPLWPASR